MSNELSKALAAYGFEPKGKGKGKRRGRSSSPGGKGKGKGKGAGKSGSPKGKGKGRKGGRKGKPYTTNNISPDQLLAWLAPNKQFRDQPRGGWAGGSQWKAPAAGHEKAWLSARSQSAPPGKKWKLCKWVAAGTPHLCARGGDACAFSHNRNNFDGNWQRLQKVHVEE